MSSESDIVIVGAGLGGLACGHLLSSAGYNVLILEKGLQVGGALQMFRRGGNLFNSGFHYIGGAGPGEMLYPVLRQFGLDSLPWKRLDDNLCDEIWIDGECYGIASGRKGFYESLAAQFPKEKDNITVFLDTLEQVSRITANGHFEDAVFSTSAQDWIEGLFSDRRIIEILSAIGVKTDLDRNMPLFIYAHVIYPYIEGSYRLQGGGGLICDTLAQSVIRNGGTIRTGQTVTRLIEKDGRVRAAVLDNGEIIEADWFISDIHPSRLLELLADCPSIGRMYRKRITGLENSTGMFTVNCELEPNSQEYLNRSIYVCSDERILISFPATDNAYADTMDILAPMSWDLVSRWENTRIGKRGHDYELFKQEYASRYISVAEKAIPGISGKVRRYWTSSPLTYRDYTGTPHGSAYGIKKDCSSPLTTFLSPRTPLSNLLMTGQNIAIHGIGGVLFAARETCNNLHVS